MHRAERLYFKLAKRLGDDERAYDLAGVGLADERSVRASRDMARRLARPPRVASRRAADRSAESFGRRHVRQSASRCKRRRGILCPGGNVDVEKKRRFRHEEGRLVMFGVPVEMNPMGLWLYAESYLKAVPAADAEATTIFTPAKTFLLARALELGLKAFLSLKGYPLSKLSGGVFGHDLDNLLSEAEKNDLKTICEFNTEERSAIRFAARYYFDKVFEYPAVLEAPKAYPGWPKNEYLLSAAHKLVPALKGPCRAA